MRVAIIGGGVVGLAIAHALVREGGEVVVLERGKVGAATSFGNAGWIVPGMSVPLPAPGVVAQGIKWMARPGSPLLIRPRSDFDFVSWLWRFWRASRRRFLAGVDALLALSRDATTLFDLYVAQGMRFEMHKGGVFLVCLSNRQIEKELHMFDVLRSRGYRGRVDLLSAEQLLEREPALSESIAGGLNVRGDRCLEPSSLTDALAQWLEQNGAQVCEKTTVFDLEQEERQWNVSTTTGRVSADRVVISAGVWSRGLVQQLGTDMPLEAGKGYSVTTLGTGARPLVPVGLMEAKVACSPFSTGVRLAGTMELAGLDLSINRRRLDAVIASAIRYFRDWRPTEPRVEWAGLRPLTPDGLPIIGRVPGTDGVFVATGHGPLGVTLAPATARSLVPLVLENSAPPELEPFSVERFARRPARRGRQRVTAMPSA